MNAIFRYTGWSETIVGSLRLNRYGQALQMDSDKGYELIKGRVSLLPEKEFKAIGFSDSQLKIWADPMMPLFEIPTDPKEAADKADFMRKRDAALAKGSEIRQGLLDGTYVIENDKKVKE